MITIIKIVTSVLKLNSELHVKQSVSISYLLTHLVFRGECINWNTSHDEIHLQLQDGTENRFLFHGVSAKNLHALDQYYMHMPSPRPMFDGLDRV